MTLDKTTQTVPALLTEREAAEFLGVSPIWLQRDRWRGPQIRFVKIGKHVRYRASDLADFIERNTAPVVA